MATDYPRQIAATERKIQQTQDELDALIARAAVAAEGERAKLQPEIEAIEAEVAAYRKSLERLHAGQRGEAQRQTAEARAAHQAKVAELKQSVDAINMGLADDVEQIAAQIDGLAPLLARLQQKLDTRTAVARELFRMTRDPKMKEAAYLDKSYGLSLALAMPYTTRAIVNKLFRIGFGRVGFRIDVDLPISIHNGKVDDTPVGDALRRDAENVTSRLRPSAERNSAQQREGVQGPPPVRKPVRHDTKPADAAAVAKRKVETAEGLLR